MLIWKIRFYIMWKIYWIILVVVFRLLLNEFGKNMEKIWVICKFKINFVLIFKICIECYEFVNLLVKEGVIKISFC